MRLDTEHQYFDSKKVYENNSLAFPFYLVVTVFLAITCWIFNFSYPYLRTMNWEKGTGTITEILSRKEFKKIKSENDHKPDHAKYKFAYSYEVDGTQYTGEAVKDVSLFVEKKYHFATTKQADSAANDINNHQYINETKQRLVIEGEKIDILYNPTSCEESMLQEDQSSVFCFITILFLFFIYSLRLLLLFYAKYKFSFKFDELKVKSALSQHKLPLELANYWSTLSIGCCVLKPVVQEKKGGNALRLSVTGFGIAIALVCIIGWIIAVFNLSFGIPFDDSYCLIFSITVAMLPLIEMSCVSYVPKGELNKKLNEYFFIAGRSGKQVVTALSNIVALQILPVYKWNGAIAGYQANMIFNPNDNGLNLNGEFKRFYILSHKKFDCVKEAADKISAFLNVPVVYDSDIKN